MFIEAKGLRAARDLAPASHAADGLLAAARAAACAAAFSAVRTPGTLSAARSSAAATAFLSAAARELAAPVSTMLIAVRRGI